MNFPRSALLLWGAALLGSAATAATPRPPAPTHENFQRLVRSSIQGTALAVARWWAADLDGNGKPDRIAVACEYESDTLGDEVTVFIQSDAGLTYQIPWKLDGRNKDLCEGVQDNGRLCVEAYCHKAQQDYERGQRSDIKLQVLLGDCAKKKLSTYQLADAAQACTNVPRFTVNPRAERFVELRSQWNSGQRTDRVALRSGKPVVIASASEDIGRHGDLPYKWRADFDKKTFHCDGEGCKEWSLNRAMEHIGKETVGQFHMISDTKQIPFEIPQ